MSGTELFLLRPKAEKEGAPPGFEYINCIHENQDKIKKTDTFVTGLSFSPDISENLFAISADFVPKVASAIEAGRTLLISNLQPLNQLETSRLEKSVSPHKVDGLKNKGLADIFLRDLTAINDFLYDVEVKSFITT